MSTRLRLSTRLRHLVHDKATAALLAAALALVLLRFVDLGTAPFINDEPILQLIVDRHIADHTIPSHSLHSNRDVDYGPTSLWFYLPLRLVTDDVRAITAWHAFCFSLGFLFLFLAVRLSIGMRAAAWTTLLAASSPYLFFYSRLPWDNTFLVPLTALTLYCLARIEKNRTSLPWWILLGATNGLIFNTHLMAFWILMAVAITAAVLGCKMPSWRLTAKLWSGCLLAFALVVSPYLWYAGSQLTRESQFRFTAEALTHALPETFFGTGLYASAAGMSYFLGDSLAPVYQALGPLAQLITIFDLGWAIRIAAWAFAAVAIARLIRRRSRPLLERFAVVSFACLLFYYYGVRPYPIHPHYFMPCFWLVFLLASMAITQAPRPLSIALQAATLVLVFTNAAFVLASHSVIAENHGTRGYHYSSTPEETRNAARFTCSLARTRGKTTANINLSATPGVLLSPFLWFSSHLPECQGVSFDFSARPPGTILPPDMLGVVLTYSNASAYDARLLVSAP